MVAVLAAVAAAVVVPVTLGGNVVISGTPVAAQSSGAQCPPAKTAASQQGVFLTMRPGSGAPLKWGATPIYDACTILPLYYLVNSGFLVQQPYDIFVDRPARGNRGGPGYSQSNTASRGVTSCSYPGHNAGDRVALQILQKPFNDHDDFSILHLHDDKGKTRHTRSGALVHVVHMDDEQYGWTVNIVTPRASAELVVVLGKQYYGDASRKKTLHTFVQRIVAQLGKPPRPPVSISYKGPYQGTADPCSLFTARDFHTLFDTSDDTHPHRRYRLGERDLVPDPGVDLPEGHYTQIRCQRFSVAADEFDKDAPAMEIQFDVYRSNKQSRTGLYAECDPRSSGADAFGPSVQLKEKIGDSRACFPDEGRNDWRLVFRSGNTVVFLNIWQHVPRSALAHRAKLLTPLARKIAGRLTDS